MGQNIMNHASIVKYFVRDNIRRNEWEGQGTSSRYSCAPLRKTRDKRAPVSSPHQKEINYCFNLLSLF